ICLSHSPDIQSSVGNWDESKGGPVMKGASMVFLMLLLTITAFAQIPSGSITGTIKDEQGALIPGVEVTLQGLDATRTFISTEVGEFRFYNLAPGPYKLTLSLPGFTTTVRDNVIVEVGKNADLPMVM